jgi:sulfur relay protein TusB/DsrH
LKLHILNTIASLDLCLSSLEKGDSLLFIEDAVVLAADGQISAKLTQNLYALADDLDRRGIKPQAEVNPIDYDAFVDLCASHQHCLSW